MLKAIVGEDETFHCLIGFTFIGASVFVYIIRSMPSEQSINPKLTELD